MAYCHAKVQIYYTTADGTLHRNPPAEHLQEALDNMQPQPTSAIATRRRPIQLPKRFENGGVGLGWDPDTGIGDTELDAALALRGGECQAALCGELYRVAQQIPENDFELPRVRVVVFK